MKIVANLKKTKQTEYETIFYYERTLSVKKKPKNPTLTILAYSIYFSIVASICFVEMEMFCRNGNACLYISLSMLCDL